MRAALPLTAALLLGLSLGACNMSANAREDDSQVLAAWGLAPEALARLRAAGAIGPSGG